MLKDIVIGVICFVVGGNVGVISMALFLAAKED